MKASEGWVIALSVLLVVMFVTGLRGGGPRHFRAWIWAMIADIGGIAYFQSGKYAAIAVAIVLFIFSAFTGRKEKEEGEDE